MAPPTQDGRYMRVESPLGKDALLLKRFWGREAVSELFDFHLEVLAINPVAAGDLLEQGVTITVTQEDESERSIHGVVRSLTSLGPEEQFHAYRLHVVPELWFLSLREDCRIFQEMDAKQIVEEVFGAYQLTHRFSCQGALATREFTVQYRESDLSFVSRLLEEEGIFFFFEHSSGSHQLVLADHQGALSTSPVQGLVTYSRPGERVHREGIIDRVSDEASIRTGKYSATDYNFETPSTDLSVSVTGTGPGELYDYPGRYATQGDGDRLAEVRQQASESLAVILRGAGTSVGLIAGYRFQLEDSADFDGEYMVLEVEHRSGTVHYGAGADDTDAEPPYRNTFEAIPYATTYRPPRRTPVPRVSGAQTAVVVGPNGEETYTDEYGRIKVRFHWDRLSPDNGESSCWIRVASTWAGDGWGAFQLPRIGQEVVVDFLEGNPDRPLVTGSVYNAEQMPPFEANPTQSGWKSHSTKQGAAESNEFRFDDKKGSEEIYLRAEKDLNVDVVNDRTTEIGNDDTLTVKHDRTTTIENDDTLTVKHDRTTTIEHDDTLTVKNDETAKVEGKQTLTVEKDQKITISSGNRTLELKQGNLSTQVKLGKITFEAMQSIEFKVGQTTVKIDPTGVTIKGAMVKVEAQALAEIKGAVAKVEASGVLQLKGSVAQLQASGPAMVKGMPTMIG